MENDRIHDYIVPGKRAHLVGIGGVSMSPLAEVLQGEGLVITGSDMKESPTVERLRALGIPVTIGHLPQSVAGADLIIRTAAVHNDNPEIAAALAQGIPVFERAQAWGSIMRRYKNALCISGTHGKTTTTSMCTHIAMAATIDPTVMIGGTLPLLGTGHRVGHGNTIILESCEYCNSFLSFFPTVAVILNIEADHLDFFKDLNDVEHSFRAFADLVPPGGTVLANGEDQNTMDALAGKEGVITFGLEKGDFHAENLTWNQGFPTFDLVREGKVLTTITLQVPGLHNVKDAIAAASAALVLGIPGEAVARGLYDFRGAGRRFEYKGTVKGAKVYDDYAHHPGELKALLDMAENLGYRRVICAFQPHTYTRTKALFSEFAQVLAQPDVTFLAEIFAARETNEVGISSQDLANAVPGAEAIPTLEELTDRLYDLAQPGDLILTVGAGNIFTVGEALVARAQANGV
jgi:UDP-N-acetylmuramate--alanine ligase